MRHKLKVNNSMIEPGTMYCLGQNYEKHAKEMGGTISKDPIVFIKPPAAFIPNNENIFLPDFSENVHHEIELIIIIKDDVINVSPDQALNHIATISIGIDVTLRDIQKKAKEKGKPWAIAKGFYTSAPIAEPVDFDTANDLDNLDIELKVNNEIRQKANTSDMVMKPAEIISYLSKVFTLRKNDVIFTGTPEGVGQIKSGDVLTASLYHNNQLITKTHNKVV